MCWQSTFLNQIKGVPSAESSRSVRGLGKGVSGKPYPRMCNARRPRLEPGTFRSQAVRLYRLHQARPSKFTLDRDLQPVWYGVSSGPLRDSQHQPEPSNLRFKI